MMIRQIDKQKRFRVGLLWMAACLLLLAGCGAGGEVVKVTEVAKDPYQGLKKDTVARIEQLKKTISEREREGESDGLSNLVQKTPNYTVAEYLRKFPESRTFGKDYKIGGYDVLAILVYEEKDLSLDSVRVAADGTLSFPLIGRIRVADLTTAEAERLIAGKLASGQFILDAHVSVTVVRYEGRKFSALGAVKNPGSFPLQAQERLLDGITKAGGIDAAAGEKQEAMVIRTLNPGKPDETRIVITFDLQNLLKGSDQISNIYLGDQDLIFVPKGDYFYIIGEVKSPGALAFTKKDITIIEAISMAGGFTPIAARNGTRIVRIENGVEKIYEVRVDAITKTGKMIQAIPIKPNDLIVVPESFF
jgi:polysaccharide export outer membrane protein